MRFKSVTAIAFGPFKNRRIELAPGMTVIAGSNGAGKSTWHAALYAGLCGMRRGGGLRREDAVFEDRHRPWGEHQWAVAAEIERDNGQRVELRHDLDGRVDCSAIDLDIGADISGDIIHDGSPDGSKFVGLDRWAFARTACVRQAEIFGVVEAADDLQDYLQRAAASTDRDATASGAIAAIVNFTSEFVGLDRRNSTKPLRVARETLDECRAKLSDAEGSHARYLARLTAHERLGNEALRLEREYARADAIRTRAAAENLEVGLRRAQRLSETLGPQAPVRLDDDQELAAAVATALSAFEDFPAPPTGEDPAALAAELAALPAEIEGDTAPDTGIVEMRRKLTQAEASAAEHALHRPRAWRPANVALGRAPLPMYVYGGGGVGIVLLVALMLMRETIAAAVIAVLLVLLGGSLLVRARSVPVPITADGDDVPEMLAWESRASQHATDVGSLREALNKAFESRGYRSSDDLDAAYMQYVNDCAMRSRHAAARSRKADLEKRLTAAESLELQRRQYERRRSELNARLEELARRCGVDGLDGLIGWQQQRSARLREAQDAIANWEQLQGLLGGRTLEELERQARTKAEEAESLAADFAAGEREEFGGAAVPTDADLRALREAANSAKSNADREAGEIESAARMLPNVAEAREALAEATAELERVEHLAKTLETARELLERAQDTVHRKLAPALVANLEKWLPVVTNGSYTRATVDPENLSVRVRAETGEWRAAMLLSHGTAEQIYLLLRVAMVDYLTKASLESCPLLLDDVTAHCDLVRSRAIMDLLHHMSKDRQIIAFTQQEAVIEWASANLDPARDRIETLDETLIQA